MGTNEKIGGGFHHVALRANDFDATVKSYTEGLGAHWMPADACDLV